MQSLLKINLAGTFNSSGSLFLQRSQYYENCYYTKIDNYVPSCINTFDGQLPEQIVNTYTAVIA